MKLQAPAKTARRVRKKEASMFRNDPKTPAVPVRKRSGALSRRALLAGTSMLALILASPQSAFALKLGGSSSPVAAPNIASDAAQTAASQAAAIARQSANALTRATQAIQALQAAQSAARAAAQSAASRVTDGLSPGGLIVDPRVTAGNTTLWQNISQPSQSVSGGQTTVTLTQSAQRAIATWQQFNVGKNTLVYFDQRGGNSSTGNSWVALNRIDAAGSPSQILGSIKAEGTVLLINPNGIIFNGTSQINVHTLIASAMDLNSFAGSGTPSARSYVPVLVNGLAQTTADGAPILAPSDEANLNASFAGGGLFTNASVRLPSGVDLTSSGASVLFSAASVPGQGNAGIVVQAGASIASGVSGFDNGGFVALLGPQVTNAGQITASAGEIILAAGNAVQIAEPAANTSQTGFAVRTGSAITGTLAYTPSALSGGASVINDTSGLLVSHRGNITLAGDSVAQLGLAETTTSITRPGSITIVANGMGVANQVVFGAGSLTAILPEENGETIPSDATSLANFTAPRIDVAAPYIDFKSGSFVLAPSAAMTVTGPGQQNPNAGDPAPLPVGRVLMEAGSTIDLSGLTATRSVADYLYTFKVTANDVADTPLAQNLIGKTVTIDLTQTGTRADGATWVGSPLFASSGASYLANVTQGIDQLLTKGGSLSFAAGAYSVGNGLVTAAFKDVVQAPSASINVSGGLIQFTGATIKTTQLIGADGRSYDIAGADPFIGNSIAGGFVVQHMVGGQVASNLTEIYSSPLKGAGYLKPGYVDGISAGSIAVSAVNPILAGTLVGDIAIGTRQRALAQAGTGTGGTQATPDQLPTGAGLSIALAANPANAADTTPVHDAVVLDSTTPDVLGANLSLTSPLLLPVNASGLAVVTYSTDALSAAALGSISISGADTLSLAQGANLSVRPGGSIKLANVTTIDGTLTAHGGAITLLGWRPLNSSSGPSDAITALTLGAHAQLDVSGQWINDTGLTDDALGALYINGGSVTLSSGVVSQIVSYDSTAQVVLAQDKSLPIVLAAGSVIDVSSGGYVGTNGRLAVGSDGLPKGKGGNLSLLTYDGSWTASTGVDYYGFFLRTTQNNFAPQAATNANVIMDGTIYAGGLSQGGSFTLQAPSITIDGNTTQLTSITTGPQSGSVVLPATFFAGGGFSTYTLTSTFGSTTVTAGTSLVLNQTNYQLAAALPASGAHLRDFASVGFAPDGLRHAASLTLNQNGYAFGVAGDASATARVLIDQGARIIADPLANITLNAGGPAVVLGSITAPGGSIAISQGFNKQHLTLPTDSLLQYLWIGDQAVLDVAGTFVPNPLVTAYATGTELPGGSITLSSPGLIVALEDSRFDISGASGTVQVPRAGRGLGGARLVSQPVWSNGGSLTVNLAGTGALGAQFGSLYFAGQIAAAGGAPEAAGGTLAINGSSSINLLISQSGNVAAGFAALPATQAQVAARLPATPTASITADTINSANSGLDTVALFGPLTFSGNVNLKVAGSLLIDNAYGATTLLPDGVTDTRYTVQPCTSAGACIPSIGANVTLEAGYIRFSNSYYYFTTSILPTLADGTLTLKASQQIDLAGVLAVNNAGTVNLVSGGDIRLIGVKNFGATVGDGGQQTLSDGYGGLPWAGSLLVADNLNLTAREIYPTTDTAFLLMSQSLAPAGLPGIHNTISIASNGQAPTAPLSAGGAILVDAKTIVQGGALYAPFGTIQLGFSPSQTLPGIFAGGTINNPYDPVPGIAGLGLYDARLVTVPTGSVTLAATSLTSVSGAGLSIPYGTTTDGTNWIDNNTLLNGPPAKLVVLGGSKVNTQAGAVIDGRGGGDIYATEFVPGTGGSRNVLTTTTQTSYALVPGSQSALAAYDPSFTTAVAAGTTVTLPGGNGIAGGTYTLLPAQYATLPGAYRVVVVAGNTSPRPVSVTTPDGSIYMTGVFGNTINGSISSQTALLQIQPKSIWSRYSEIDINKGNAYFARLAAGNGNAAPRLAQDAARLVVAAASSLVLNATNRFTPDTGGLGGQLDIAGSNIVVAASDHVSNFGTVTGGVFTPNSSYAGYLLLDPDVLSNLGIESTLIGGFRSTTTARTLITATAANLEIAGDAAHPLTGPDLLFTALAPTAADPSVHGITVDAGSVIAAKGTVSGTSSPTLVFGADPVAVKNNATGAITSWTAGVSGDGALLRVSNGRLATVVRHFVPGVYRVPTTSPAPTPPVSTVARGNLAIGANVVLSGNALTLDSSGSTTVDATASLDAKNYDLSGSVINLGGGSGGLVITRDLFGKFAGADLVRLRSASVFNLYGSNSYGDTANPIGTLTLDGSGITGDGGASAITATNIVLVDSQATASSNTAGAGGSLALDAGSVLTFGAGAKTFAGFAGITATAGSQILFTGSGSLDAKGAGVSLTAPLIVVDTGASQSLTTTGALTLAPGTGAAPALAPTLVGGALTLTAGSIDDSASLVAQGGKLILEATSGDLVLSGSALLSAAGTRIAINGLVQDTPAGSIRLYADHGNVTLRTGATVDVSAAGRGYAGALSIYASGTATLGGTLKGGAQYSDLGGEFVLIAGQLAGSLPLTSGFTRSFAVSLGQGEITIGSGQTLTSENVLLVANTGGITIDGTIDASAASGGAIALYGAGNSTAAAGTNGASGVTIGSGAKLYARYRAADVNSPGYGNGESTLVQKGGTITLGTSGTPDGTLNATYGYQNVPGSGAITVASGAILDVSGGAGGANIDNTGGSVIVRAPILSATSPTNPNAINVSFNGTVVTNAKADGTASGSPLVANAFAVWSTTDSAANPDTHFDGIIDPAGFFNAAGTRIISADANGLYPVSTAASPASGAYTPHVNFYQSTLLNFVNAPFDGNAVKGSFGAQLQVVSNPATALPPSMLHLRPEIDLVNPTPATGAGSINAGNITVASNWNFGAGSIDTSGNVNLLYRTTNGGEPGSLTLRAANNVTINATITDGFFANYAAGGVGATDAATLYNNELASSPYQAYLAMFQGGALQYSAKGAIDLVAALGLSWVNDLGTPAPADTVSASTLDPQALFNISQSAFDSLQFRLQAPTVISGSANVVDQYNQYYAQYLNMFRAYETEINTVNTRGVAQFANDVGVPGVTGGIYVSYSNYSRIINAIIGGVNVSPAIAAIPSAPTTATPYYDIQNGLGKINFSGTYQVASTTASDYATRWATYFFNVLNLNSVNYAGGALKSIISVPTVANAAGFEASQDVLVAIPVAPPYAPPAYTSIQPNYISSAIVNPPTPADTIANNPAIYSVGNVAVVNTTSAANLMTAAVSGKGSFSYDLVGGALFNASGASSVNPNAVVPLSSLTSGVTGNVTVDGHTSYTNPVTSLTVDVPTLVRTGAGAITIAAAGNFALLDTIAPGAVYTAGTVADNAGGFTAPVLQTSTKNNGLVTNPVWATGGGNLTIAAGRDIVGIETPVDQNGSQLSPDGSSAGVSTGQFWSAWYYVNGKLTSSSVAPFDPTGGGEQYSSWINYGTFFQGLGALGGGNIALKAGRNVQDISASIPETIQVSGGQSATGPAASVHYYGGGDLVVEAGGDVLSGAYYVGRGTGLIKAGGAVSADATLYQSFRGDHGPVISSYSNPAVQFSVPLLLAVQDSFITVQAPGAINLGGIFEPTSIPSDYSKNVPPPFSGIPPVLPVNIGASFDSYGANAGVALTSTAGAVSVSSLDSLYQGTLHLSSNALPPTLQVTALSGDINLSNFSGNTINLYPSASGELSLVAGGSIYGSIPGRPTIASVTVQDTAFSVVPGVPVLLSAPLHAGDTTPVLIDAGVDIYGGSYSFPKPAQLYAGRDIVNINFTGQNNAAGDITSLIAGRDIAAIPTAGNSGTVIGGTLTATLYGPGDLLVQAGRNLGPFNGLGLNNVPQAGGGIFAVGNGANSGNGNVGVRPFLPLEGANVTLRYGVAGGIDYAAAIAKYGDPAVAAASGIDFLSTIIPQLEQLIDGLIAKQATALGIANPSVSVTLTPAEAAALFTALPTLAINQKLADLAARAGLTGLSFNLLPSDLVNLQQQQQEMKLAIDRGFLNLLTQVGLDYNNSSSPYHNQYARAYQAIATLFPASLGYTDNSNSGGSSALVHTGDLRMARSLVETQTGGDINIIGPGGNAFVGSNSADNLSPAQQGILTLQGGSIRTYTDGSVLIYQSRIFTEQGGDVDLFSANGDLNAGKGPKSSAAYPPLRLICDVDGYCRVNPSGLVTGAGIGALLTIPGQDPSKSNSNLTAPHGIIDAGAAGIRVAGNLNLVALQVLNAFNVQVGGATAGIPATQGPPVAALTTASTANTATQQAGLPAQSNNNDRPSILIVEIEGYGGSQGDDSDERGRRGQ